MKGMDILAESQQLKDSLVVCFLNQILEDDCITESLAHHLCHLPTAGKGACLNSSVRLYSDRCLLSTGNCHCS